MSRLSAQHGAENLIKDFTAAHESGMGLEGLPAKYKTDESLRDLMAWGAPQPTFGDLDQLGIADPRKANLSMGLNLHFAGAESVWKGGDVRLNFLPHPTKLIVKISDGEHTPILHEFGKADEVPTTSHEWVSFFAALYAEDMGVPDFFLGSAFAQGKEMQGEVTGEREFIVAALWRQVRRHGQVVQRRRLPDAGLVLVFRGRDDGLPHRGK